MQGKCRLWSVLLLFHLVCLLLTPSSASSSSCALPAPHLKSSFYLTLNLASSSPKSSLLTLTTTINLTPSPSSFSPCPYPSGSHPMKGRELQGPRTSGPQYMSNSAVSFFTFSLTVGWLILVPWGARISRLTICSEDT